MTQDKVPVEDVEPSPYKLVGFADLKPGWYVYDGNSTTYYPGASSASEAREWCIEEGSWEEREIHAWREGTAQTEDGDIVDVIMDDGACVVLNKTT